MIFDIGPDTNELFMNTFRKNQIYDNLELTNGEIFEDNILKREQKL